MVSNSLIISTAHMPGAEPSFGVHSSYKYLYGYFMFVSSEWEDEELSDEDNPEWVKRILSEASSLGCEMVVFDADAPESRLFPTYQWG